MAKIDSQFIAKTAEKPYPRGLKYLYSSYKGVPNVPREVSNIPCLM